MAPHDVQPPSPEPSPPQFYPVHIHPEFGYLALALPLRRKVSLVGKGVLFGLVAGAIVMMAVSPDRRTRMGSAFDIQTRAVAGDMPAAVPVRFLAPSLAMGAAIPRAPIVSVMPSVVAPAEAAVAAVAPEPTVVAPMQQKAAKPKKKLVRQPQRERNDRSTEPDPRSAHAGPYRRYGGPPPERFERRPFGFGW